MSEGDSDLEAITTQLKQHYVNAEYVSHEVDLQSLYTIDSALDASTRKQRLIVSASTLEDISPCSLALEEFRSNVSKIDSNVSYLRYHEHVLAFAGTLVDVTLQHPDVDRATVTRRLNWSIREGPDRGLLANASESLLDLVLATAEGKAILHTLDFDKLSHPDDTSDSIESIVRRRVNTGNLESVNSLRESIAET